MLSTLYLVYGAALLAVAGLPSLWGDEGFTARMAQLPWASMLSDLQFIDINMGLYYATVHAVTDLLGTGPTALRLVSVMSVVGTLPLLTWLARRILPVTIGWWALAPALVFAINPYTIQLAQTARPYALLLFGSAVTACLLLRAIRLGTPLSWLAWSLAGSLLLYVHLLAVFVLAAQVVYATVVAQERWPQLVWATALLTIALIPTAVYLAPSDTLNWVPEPTLGTSLSAAARAFGGPLSAAVLLLGAVGGVRQLWASHRGEPWRHEALLLPVSLLVIPLISFIVVLPYQSLLVDEYLSVFLVPLTLLTGVAVATMPGRWRAVSAGVVVVASVVGVATDPGIYRTGSQDWRALSKRLATKVTPDDAVTFPNVFYRIVAEYYALPPDAAPAEWTRAQPILPAAPWGSLRPYQLDRIKRLGLLSDAQAWPPVYARQRSVWLVGPQEPLFDSAQQYLLGSGWRLRETLTVDGVVARHFTRH